MGIWLFEKSKKNCFVGLLVLLHLLCLSTLILSSFTSSFTAKEIIFDLFAKSLQKVDSNFQSLNLFSFCQLSFYPLSFSLTMIKPLLNHTIITLQLIRNVALCNLQLEQLFSTPLIEIIQLRVATPINLLQIYLPNVQRQMCSF